MPGSSPVFLLKSSQQLIEVNMIIPILQIRKLNGRAGNLIKSAAFRACNLCTMRPPTGEKKGLDRTWEKGLLSDLGGSGRGNAIEPIP